MPDSLAKLAKGLEPLDKGKVWHCTTLQQLKFFNAALAAVRELDRRMKRKLLVYTKEHQADVETVARLIVQMNALAYPVFPSGRALEAARRLMGEK